MGDDTTSTVYAGELQGISLALKIAQEDRSRGNSRSKVLIYTDNQAAIRSTAKPKDGSQRTLGSKVTKKRIERQRKQQVGEKATSRDQKQQNRSSYTHSNRPSRHGLPKRQSRRGKETEYGRASFRHTPKPSRKVLDLHDGLSKKHSALLTQLRTEKIDFKDFLYNRKVPGISSNRYPCG
ncbi:hypothetical protein HZS61_004597 [Fusarium oxysporum f. sp. conglutinans]|uniref:RNase H type-1 domain-containing protein n=1 Tax=Fusarium oxysporum f. sp. conglutinans TaxID=100902 RepID=A0A8H6GE52_FUSOX|nr:hypothetical protein HZS61_004597 [Fusarium oxysporum f. sp. conglutinans]